MASNHVVQMTRKSSAMAPTVRALLSQYQIDPTRIASTGPHQILLKSDVLNYIGQNNLKPADKTNVASASDGTQAEKPKAFTPNLDISGHQPQGGPDGFSKIAKKLLDM